MILPRHPGSRAQIRQLLFAPDDVLAPNESFEVEARLTDPADLNAAKDEIRDAVQSLEELLAEIRTEHEEGQRLVEEERLAQRNELLEKQQALVLRERKRTEKTVAEQQRREEKTLEAGRAKQQKKITEAVRALEEASVDAETVAELARKMEAELEAEMVAMQRELRENRAGDNTASEAMMTADLSSGDPTAEGRRSGPGGEEPGPSKRKRTSSRDLIQGQLDALNHPKKWQPSNVQLDLWYRRLQADAAPNMVQPRSKLKNKSDLTSELDKLPVVIEKMRAEVDEIGPNWTKVFEVDIPGLLQLEPESFTKTGVPKVSAEALKGVLKRERERRSRFLTFGASASSSADSKEVAVVDHSAASSGSEEATSVGASAAAGEGEEEGDEKSNSKGGKKSSRRKRKTTFEDVDSVEVARLKDRLGENPEFLAEEFLGSTAEELITSENRKFDFDPLDAFDPSLLEYLEINSTLNGFLRPLYDYVEGSKEENPRVYVNLNLYTETGRLSCRQPNLQNIPTSLNRYPIRSCFRAAEGNAFVIMDYSQLELRVLAHLARCPTMIESFRQGGDFHSRSAALMFPHVMDAALRPGGDDDNLDLLYIKENFKEERQRAKTLNFSVVYGVTKFGLDKLLNLPGGLDEAQEVIDVWYSNFPAVKQWQREKQQFARKHGFVETLMGRRRLVPLNEKTMPATHGSSGGRGGQSKVRAGGRSAKKSAPDASNGNASAKQESSITADAQEGSENNITEADHTVEDEEPPSQPPRMTAGYRKHLERVAINTPVQGSAADIVNCAMVDLHKSKELKDLGFVQVLQIHDELILEGPRENAVEAERIVKRLAERPSCIVLNVPLVVNSEVRETWG